MGLSYNTMLNLNWRPHNKGSSSGNIVNRWHTDPVIDPIGGPISNSSIPDTFNLTINKMVTPFKVLSRDEYFINIIEEYSSDVTYKALFGLFSINEDIIKYEQSDPTYSMTLFDINSNLLFDSVKNISINLTSDTQFPGYMKVLHTFQLPNNTSATVFKTERVDIILSI